MVPAFNDYVFSAKVGDVGLVETDFGFHVVKITDQKAGVQLATIVRNIVPSSATINEVYTNITAFNEAALKNPKDFAAIATKQGYSVLPANNLEALAEDIPGLGSNRQVVRWAFEEDTKVGDIHRFDVKGSAYQENQRRTCCSRRCQSHCGTYPYQREKGKTNY